MSKYCKTIRSESLPLPGIWAEVGICIKENYYFPPTGSTGEVLAIQTPTKSRLANPGIEGLGGDLYDYAFRHTLVKAFGL